MITDTRLSILTRTLFEKVGNLEAVSAITGLSMGQLSKCQSLPGPERETSVLSLKAILRLEEMLGDPVMTGALAADVLAGSSRAEKSLLTEVCEMAEAASDLQRAVRTARDKPSPNERAALVRLLDKAQSELDDVRAKLSAVGG